MRKKNPIHVLQHIPLAALLVCTLLVCIFLFGILWHIFSKAYPTLTLDFILSNPRNGMTEGGILPALIGTVLLTLLTTLVSMPLGVGCAIYLNEYAKDGWITKLIRVAIRNLAGIPSIIYGLFGLAFFVQTLHIGTSLLAAGCTLGLLSLPYIVSTTEEALKTIPNRIREAGLALGATKFETIRDLVLPAAIPGIATGLVLSLSRAAGETAPILFTGAAFFITGLPGNPLNEFMALPYHLYILSTQHQSIELVKPLAYATAAVLIILVFVLNLIAIFIRQKYRNLLQ